MKKILFFSAFIVALISCNGASESNATAGDTTNSAGMTNPSAIDTTEHPNGMTNGDVISTDTAAINVKNSVDKAKASQKQ